MRSVSFILIYFYRAKAPSNTLDENREWVRAQLLKMTSIPTPSAHGVGGVDMDTLPPSYPRASSSPLSQHQNIKQDATGLLVDKVSSVHTGKSKVVATQSINIGVCPFS